MSGYKHGGWVKGSKTIWCLGRNAFKVQQSKSSSLQKLMDQAVNDLSPKQFTKFLDDISMMLADYEDGQEGK